MQIKLISLDLLISGSAALLRVMKFYYGEYLSKQQGRLSANLLDSLRCSWICRRVGYLQAALTHSKMYQVALPIGEMLGPVVAKMFVERRS